MGKLKNICRSALLLAMLPSVLSSCIDEDMSDCGNDYKIVYKMNLRTNLSTEIEQTLTTADEQAFAPTLKSALSSVFTDYAHDNDLLFFVDGKVAKHEANEMNGNTATYTIYLDRNDYRHLALANTKDESQVSATGTDSQATFALQQISGDTIDSHRNGLFTARKSIAADDFDKDIYVNLYMANCAAVVLIDQSEAVPDNLLGYASGMNTYFSVNDSTYSKKQSTILRARSVYDTTSTKASDGTATEPSDSKYNAVYAVGFPSEKDLWTFDIIARINGKYTKTTLTVNEPLKAGQLKIIKTKLKADGSLTTVTVNVGVSVKLDWKPGGEHDVEI